ncbi:iron-containing alcohol dehydrogenase [Glaciecola sp. SC05]|uniref:iron-containing alcohol dehydrogenase n=1 Tax=Glaciecola sp. SC05 TaxID=1987355 RepID=UPI00352800B5
MQGFEFNTTKRILCEIGAIKLLAQQCQSLNIGRPVIITDAGIVACGLLATLLNNLHNLFTDDAIAVFDKVEADPSEDIVQNAVDFAKAHNADGIIGFGGGSSMDTAKIVAILSQQQNLTPQTLQNIYGVDQVAGTRLPLILIPTTAGTGSEVTQIAIVTTGETTKAGIVSKQLLPDIALLDAELTTGLPAHVTAATGIDAMVHAIEAYTSKIKKNVYSDMLAKEALRLLSQNIETATFNGHDLNARQNMLLGACLAGQAFANAPVAAVHALAYPLGGHFHIPHGLSNALVLPHVLKFNEEIAFKAYAELTPFVIKGVEQEQTPHALSQLFIEHLESLITRLKIPNKLHMLGVKEKHLPKLAKDAMLQTRLLINNPKEMTYVDALAIYKRAF